MMNYQVRAVRPGENGTPGQSSSASIMNVWPNHNIVDVMNEIRPVVREL